MKVKAFAVVVETAGQGISNEGRLSSVTHYQDKQTPELLFDGNVQQFRLSSGDSRGTRKNRSNVETTEQEQRVQAARRIEAIL